MNTIDKPNYFKKIKTWVVEHKKIVVIIFCSLVIIGLTIFTMSIFIRKPHTAEKPEPVAKVIKPEPIKINYYSKLTGLLVENEEAISAPISAVMIENSPEARPQSGLKQAEIVFEAIAEGGITRFLTLFQNNKPEIIGPVRSIRMYYVNWVAAFDASIAHCGGSAEALSEVRNGNYRDIDELFNSSYFWRASDRYAPHNLYTSAELLEKINNKKGYTKSNFTAFKRVDGKPSETLDATNIKINVSSYLFNSSYAYDVEKNTYNRFQAGEAHLDREQGQISPNVVIAIRVNEYTMADGHENISTINSGEATIFQNGTAISAIWTKASPTSQIVFTDVDGSEIPLVNGQTWIVAVPNNGNGAVSWS